MDVENGTGNCLLLFDDPVPSCNLPPPTTVPIPATAWLFGGALGAWITTTVSPEVLRWILGLSFLGMAIWTLIPDEIENEETRIAQRFGVFGATFITFFLAEMGDKRPARQPDTHEAGPLACCRDLCLVRRSHSLGGGRQAGFLRLCRTPQAGPGGITGGGIERGNFPILRQ